LLLVKIEEDSFMRVNCSTGTLNRSAREKEEKKRKGAVVAEVQVEHVGAAYVLCQADPIGSTRGKSPTRKGKEKKEAASIARVVHSSSRFAFLQLIVHEQKSGSYTSQRSNRVRAQLTSVEDRISGPSNRIVRHLL
jgi:hypothetical protein